MTGIKRFLQELDSEFELSASGKLTLFLGCKVEQDLQLTQGKYCNDVLTRFQMPNANAVHTLASIGWNKQPSARFAGRAMNRQHLQ